VISLFPGKLLPLRNLQKSRNRHKSHGVKSGGWGGCSLCYRLVIKIISRNISFAPQTIQLLIPTIDIISTTMEDVFLYQLFHSGNMNVNFVLILYKLFYE
jgi:hypothetical protein